MKANLAYLGILTLGFSIELIAQIWYLNTMEDLKRVLPWWAIWAFLIVVLFAYFSLYGLAVVNHIFRKPKPKKGEPVIEFEVLPQNQKNRRKNAPTNKQY